MLFEGNPDEDIQKWLKTGRLILLVIGTHGRMGLKHIFMGSVAERVILHFDFRYDSSIRQLILK